MKISNSYSEVEIKWGLDMPPIPYAYQSSLIGNQGSWLVLATSVLNRVQVF